MAGRMSFLWWKLSLKPVDINGVNKIPASGIMVYRQAYGMPTVSLRLVNTYGPRQLVKHARQGFIGWFVKGDRRRRNPDFRGWKPATRLQLY
jgi:hypothetical protein